MAVGVPKPPYNAPFLDSGGYLSEPWSKWFRQAFVRIGADSALSNKELETAQSSDVTTLQATVTALQVSVNNMQNQIGGLGVGPIL